MFFWIGKSHYRHFPITITFSPQYSITHAIEVFFKIYSLLNKNIVLFILYLNSDNFTSL